MIYLDYAASAPVLPSALEAAMPFLSQGFGNPSSIHTLGREAALAIVSAREMCAEALGCLPGEIIFTSGGTESDNTAIFSALKSTRRRKIVTVKTEHHAVLNPCREAAKYGFELVELSVNSEGTVSLEEAEREIDGNTALVSVMLVNNEIGTIQPIEEIGGLCRRKGVPFHTDAAAAVGKIPVELQKLPVDMLSLSAQKFGGFKGSGLLYVRSGTELSPMILGGGQENGRRSGTENTAAIAALAAALREACTDISEKQKKQEKLRDRLIESLSPIPGSRLNGGIRNRVCSNVNFSFEGIDGEALVLNLDIMGVCASSASACQNGRQKRSHVLSALGLEEKWLDGSLRLSIGEKTTEDEISEAAEIIALCVKRLRGAV